MRRGPQIEAWLGFAQGLDRQKLLVRIDARRLDDPMTPRDGRPHGIGNDLPMTFSEELEKLFARVAPVSEDEFS